MVEAYSHLKLLLASILNMYKVFEHIDMLSIGVGQQPCTVIHPTWLRFGGFGSLMELKWCHYVMVEADSYLKLLPACILDIYKVFEHIWYAVHRHTVSALHSYPPYLALIWGLWVTYAESTWCHYIMVEADSPLKLLPVSMLTIWSVWAHWYAVHGHIVAALHSYTHTT